MYCSSLPPSRVCVATRLPENVLIKIEAIVWRSVTSGGAESGRSSLHVQSHSEWAPANIGPYSQAYTVRSFKIKLSTRRTFIFS